MKDNRLLSKALLRMPEMHDFSEGLGHVQASRHVCSEGTTGLYKRAQQSSVWIPFSSQAPGKIKSRRLFHWQQPL